MELKLGFHEIIHSSHYLLIVPYGIETTSSNRHNQSHPQLLIVPYGIETYKQSASEQAHQAFNRTLWN